MHIREKYGGISTEDVLFFILTKIYVTARKTIFHIAIYKYIDRYETYDSTNT